MNSTCHPHQLLPIYVTPSASDLLPEILRDSQMRNGFLKCCIFMLSEFYEIKESESNEPSVKMGQNANIFLHFLSSWSKLDEKCCIFTLGGFRKLKQTESNEPSVKISNIATIFLHFPSNNWKIVRQFSFFHDDWILRIERNWNDWTRCQNIEYRNHFPSFPIK